MKKINFLFLTILLLAVAGCSTCSNKSRKIDVAMTNDEIKLDSILIGQENTKVTMEIMEGTPAKINGPGTNNCYFFMDPISKKEYKLLSGEGIKFDQWATGPIKFMLTFERLDNGMKLVHLVGGKEGLPTGIHRVGFYDIILEE